MDVVDSQNIHVYNKYCKKALNVCISTDQRVLQCMYVWTFLIGHACMSVCVYMYVYICMCMFVDKSGSDRG